MDPYSWGAAWALVTVLATCRAQSETEEDEKRPYKFAFAIEGYQHRSEEKDERGIIMGEFGFVTGDGVYHVTVYATDENGDFKILSMKNFYIGLPGEGTTAAPATRAPPPPPRPTTSTPTTTKSPILQHLQGLMGCSGCIVPDKSKSPPSDYGDGLIDERFGGSPKAPLSNSASKRPGYTPGFGKPGSAGTSERPGVNGSPQSSGRPSGNAVGSRPSTSNGGFDNGLSNPGGLTQKRPSLGPQSASPQLPVKGKGPQTPAFGGFGMPPSVQSGETPGPGSDRFGGTPAQGGKLPGPGSPGQSSRPVSTPQGIPPMSEKDLMALLYRFNYTLRYHGHHEDGYRNGDKEGDYFFNGRDGLGRNVKYLANEFGFQPNITLVQLGQSPDIPSGGVEDNELRFQEFEWFYRR